MLTIDEIVNTILTAAVVSSAFHWSVSALVKPRAGGGVLNVALAELLQQTVFRAFIDAGLNEIDRDDCDARARRFHQLGQELGAVGASLCLMYHAVGRLLDGTLVHKIGITTTGENGIRRQYDNDGRWAPVQLVRLVIIGDLGLQSLRQLVSEEERYGYYEALEACAMLVVIRHANVGCRLAGSVASAAAHFNIYRIRFFELIAENNLEGARQLLVGLATAAAMMPSRLYVYQLPQGADNLPLLDTDDDRVGHDDYVRVVVSGDRTGTFFVRARYSAQYQSVSVHVKPQVSLFPSVVPTKGRLGVYSVGSTEIRIFKALELQQRALETAAALAKLRPPMQLASQKAHHFTGKFVVPETISDTSVVRRSAMPASVMVRVDVQKPVSRMLVFGPSGKLNVQRDGVDICFRRVVPVVEAASLDDDDDDDDINDNDEGGGGGDAAYLLYCTMQVGDALVTVTPDPVDRSGEQAQQRLRNDHNIAKLASVGAYNDAAYHSVKQCDWVIVEAEQKWPGAGQIELPTPPLPLDIVLTLDGQLVKKWNVQVWPSENTSSFGYHSKDSTIFPNGKKSVSISVNMVRRFSIYGRYRWRSSTLEFVVSAGRSASASSSGASAPAEADRKRKQPSMDQ